MSRQVAIMIAATCGVALATLWGWFIAPLGAPAISAALAVGVVMAGRLVTFDTRIYEDHELDYVSSYAMSFCLPLLALAVGAIVRVWL